MPDDKGISLTYQHYESIYSADEPLLICSASLVFLTRRIATCTHSVLFILSGLSAPSALKSKKMVCGFFHALNKIATHLYCLAVSIYPSC